MNILHIDSSLNQTLSVSRQLTRAVVNKLTEASNNAHIVYRDLVKDEISHLTGHIAAGFRPLPGEAVFSTEDVQEHLLSATLVNEFLTSDIIVIGAPMYNFSVSSQLKAWLDRLAQPGKTFNYTAQGPVGLAVNQRAIVVSSRGGFYHNTPLQEMDFQEHYLGTFLRFLGITHIEFVRAEGASKGEAVKQQEINRALDTLSDVINSITHP